MLCLASESFYCYCCVSVVYALVLSASPSPVSPSVHPSLSRAPFPCTATIPAGDVFYSLINFTLDY